MIYVVIFVSLGAIAIVLWVLLSTQQRNTVINETPNLWQGKNYPCQTCGQPMQQGYVLAGKGLIWSPRSNPPIGLFAHIGQTLDNTISLHLPPALNMAWHCPHCQQILIDHSLMVKSHTIRPTK